MTQIQLFERLERAINLIVRHPFYPGKQDAIDVCLEDLEDRVREGLLTQDEKARLVVLLSAADSIEEVGTGRQSLARKSS